MTPCSRRRFLQASLGAAAAGSVITTPAVAAAKRSATDWVTLGRSGVKVTRLAFGTGTFGGRVQRELGQAEFTKLVRHAYDRGIRFFETADNYDQMHEMLAEALKGIPRDSYRLMTKFRWRDAEKPFETLDRFRKETNSEYFDIVLLHNVRTATWAKELERLRDAISEAKHKKILMAHGVSAHGLKPAGSLAGEKWLDVALMRMNHNGARMDNLEGDNNHGDHAAAIANVRAAKKTGMGVLGMKLVGEGRFKTPAERDASIRYVIKNQLCDAMTIGYKSPAEIDEAIERINTHLNS
jgi:aryl-alcohol dehydrogenase-like predicted oxidoreductase